MSNKIQSAFLLFAILFLSCQSQNPDSVEIFFPSNVGALSSNFSFYWQFNENSTITMGILYTGTTGWVSIGYGVIGSEDADITVAQISGGQVSINDYYAPQNEQPTLDTDQSCQDNIELLGYTINSTSTFILFQRQLNTNDLCDYVLAPNYTFPVTWAYSNASSFNYQTGIQGSTLLNFTTNGNVVPQIPNDTALVMPANIAQLATTISFYWEFNPNDTVTLGIAFVGTNGWVGVGYGGIIMGPSDGLGTDLNVAFIQNGTVTMEDLNGYNPSFDTDIGCQDNVELLGYNITNGVTYIVFQRAINTNDVCDYILTPNETLDMIWAFNTDDPAWSFQYHGGQNRETATINFTTGGGNLPVQNDSAFLPPQTGLLSTNGDISLYWNFNGNNTVTLAIAFGYTNGWVGVGYGTSKMAGADITAVFITNGTVTIDDYYAAGEDTPTKDSDIPGCLDNLVLLGYTINQTTTLVTYIRALNTSDACDTVLSQNDAMPFIWAFNQDGDAAAFDYHGENKGSTILAFVNGNPPPTNISNGTATLPSAYSVINSDLTFYWDFDQNSNSITMAFAWNQPQGWVGIGFGSSQMTPPSGSKNVDVITALVKDGVVTVNDYFSLSEGQPSFDTSSNGCVNNVVLVGYNVTDTKSFIVFQRAINTNDPCDFVLNPNPTLDIIWAWAPTPDITVIHPDNDKDAATINFEPSAAGNATTNIDFKALMIIIHSWFLAIGWGVLIDISLFFGRYLKTWNGYILTHSILAGIVVIGSLFLEIIVIVQHAGAPRTTNLITWHFILGLIALIMMGLQTMGGLFLQWKINSVTLFKGLHISKLGHTISGSIIYVVAKANIVIGIIFHNEGSANYTKLIWATVIYYVALFIFKTLSEAMYQIRGREKVKFIPKPLESSSGQESEKLVALVNENTPISAIEKEFPGLKWVILDDNVYIMNQFLHPGGNFIIEEVRTREIGRFIYGAYGLEILGDSTKHNHTSFAVKALEKYFVGKAINEYQIFSDTTSDAGKIKLDLMGDDSKIDLSADGKLNLSGDTKIPLIGTTNLEYSFKWNLINRTQISSSIARYEFKHPGFRIRNRVNKIQHLGKHFKVYHKEHPSIRLYTVILALQQENIEFRKYLYRLFENESEVNIEIKKPINYSLYSEALPLVIKTYTVSTAFSMFLTNKPVPSSGFSISGPFGLGLGLSEQSQGDHYIFAAGTGILPFLDLFDNLLRKIMFDIIKDNHGSKAANDLNIIDEALAESISPNLRFHVFLSFRELDDFAGLDIIEKLCELGKKHKKSLFKATVRIGSKASVEHVEVTESKFDAAFVNRVVDKGASKVYICGPPVFNGLIYEASRDMGIEKESIVMV